MSYKTIANIIKPAKSHLDSVFYESIFMKTKY